MADAKRRKTGDQGPGHSWLLLTQFAGWLLIIAAACILGLARPQATTIADRIYQTVPRQGWNMGLIRHIGPVLVAAIGCTLLGLLIYALGLRRGRISFPVSLILTGLLAAAGLVAFLRYTPGF